MVSSKLWKSGEEQPSRGSCECKGPEVGVGLPRMKNDKEQCGLSRRRAEDKVGWEWMTEARQSIENALVLTPREMGPQ